MPAPMKSSNKAAPIIDQPYGRLVGARPQQCGAALYQMSYLNAGPGRQAEGVAKSQKTQLI